MIIFIRVYNCIHNYTLYYTSHKHQWHFTILNWRYCMLVMRGQTVFCQYDGNLVHTIEWQSISYSRFCHHAWLWVAEGRHRRHHPNQSSHLSQLHYLCTDRHKCGASQLQCRLISVIVPEPLKHPPSWLYQQRSTSVKVLPLPVILSPVAIVKLGSAESTHDIVGIRNLGCSRPRVAHIGYAPWFRQALDVMFGIS